MARITVTGNGDRLDVTGNGGSAFTFVHGGSHMTIEAKLVPPGPAARGLEPVHGCEEKH